MTHYTSENGRSAGDDNRHLLRIGRSDACKRRFDQYSVSSRAAPERRFSRQLPYPPTTAAAVRRSEEHTSELQSLMRISYAVFCLKKKQHRKKPTQRRNLNE